MWSDWLVVCDCGFSLSALWCPLLVPTVLLGFLLSGCGLSLHGYSSKAQPLLLILDVGWVQLRTPDLGHGISPLGHSCAGQPLLLWLDSQAQPDHKPHASRNSSHLVNQDLWRAFCPFTGRSRGLSSSHCYLSHCKVLSANGAKGWASTLNLNGSVKTYKTF